MFVTFLRQAPFAQVCSLRSLESLILRFARPAEAGRTLKLPLDVRPSEKLTGLTLHNLSHKVAPESQHE